MLWTPVLAVLEAGLLAGRPAWEHRWGDTGATPSSWLCQLQDFMQLDRRAAVPLLITLGPLAVAVSGEYGFTCALPLLACSSACSAVYEPPESLWAEDGPSDPSRTVGGHD